jgi:hypothetical protein
MVDFQWRFELKGFTAVERATLVVFGDYIMPSSSLSVTMDREAKTPAGMVHQTDAVTATFDIGSLQKTPATLAGIPGFEDLPAVLLGDYWLDQYERHQQTVQAILRRRRLSEAGVLEARVPQRWPRAFVGRRHGIIPGRHWQAGTRHLGAGRIPARPGRFPCLRCELV